MTLSERYENLKTRVIRLDSQRQNVIKNCKAFKADYEKLLVEQGNNTQNAIIQEASLAVTRTIIDKMSEEHIKTLLSLLTLALQTIFFDRKYWVEMDIPDRSNKSASFVLVEQLPDGTMLRTGFDDIGGGVVTVVGFVSQLYYLGYYRQSKVIFCDESFSQISDFYLEPLLEFLNQLSEKKGFIFVLISHDQRLIPKAPSVYEIELGTVKKVK